MSEEIRLVFPEWGQDLVSAGLRELTRAISAAGHAHAVQGLLGGEWGYGAEFENAVFEMHPYYWEECDCGFAERRDAWQEGHAHDSACYQIELERRQGQDDADWGVAERLAQEWGLPRYGCAVHCTCSHDAEFEAWSSQNDHHPRCPIALPNFRHKASGYEVRFYKYIGRSMEIENPGKADFTAILQECRQSL